jgi:hypothetical protein
MAFVIIIICAVKTEQRTKNAFLFLEKHALTTFNISRPVVGGSTMEVTYMVPVENRESLGWVQALSGCRNMKTQNEGVRKGGTNDGE